LVVVVVEEEEEEEEGRIKTARWLIIKYSGC
jgi:hypothetical protein